MLFVWRWCSGELVAAGGWPAGRPRCQLLVLVRPGFGEGCEEFPGMCGRNGWFCWDGRGCGREEYVVSEEDEFLSDGALRGESRQESNKVKAKIMESGSFA